MNLYTSVNGAQNYEMSGDRNPDLCLKEHKDCCESISTSGPRSFATHVECEGSPDAGVAGRLDTRLILPGCPHTMDSEKPGHARYRTGANFEPCDVADNPGDGTCNCERLRKCNCEFSKLDSCCVGVGNLHQVYPLTSVSTVTHSRTYGAVRQTLCRRGGWGRVTRGWGSVVNSCVTWGVLLLLLVCCSRAR